MQYTAALQHALKQVISAYNVRLINYYTGITGKSMFSKKCIAISGEHSNCVQAVDAAIKLLQSTHIAALHDSIAAEIAQYNTDAVYNSAIFYWDAQAY